MRRSYPNVLAYFFGTPWAIHPAKLAELRAVLMRRAQDDSAELAALESAAPVWRENSPIPPPVAFEDDSPSSTPQQKETGAGYRLIGSVALIKIGGTISPRPSMFDEWSGGTSHEAIGRATDAAVADGKAESIVYDIDSPGGVVYGMPENAEKVLAAKKMKPTKAIAHHVAASAAYWYAAQAASVAVTPAGMVGSVGVLMNALDYTEALKTAGIKDELVSNDSSPFKAEGYPQFPLSDEHRAEMKRACNLYADMFVSALAKGRGLRAAKIEKDFGKGRMLMPEEALAAGMVDEITTLAAIMDSLNKPKGRGAKRNIAAKMVEYNLPRS